MSKERENKFSQWCGSRTIKECQAVSCDECYANYLIATQETYEEGDRWK